METTVSRRTFVTGATTAAAVAAVASTAVAHADEAAEGPQVEAGLHTWEIKPEPITDIAETRDYDIVIVGAGLSGLATAEAAARNGAKVAVLERTDGIQLRGIDVSAIGSNWLKKHGVNLPARTAARVQYQWGNQTANYNLLYTWASQTGHVWDYIEELCEQSGLHMVNALSATAKYGWDTLPEKWHVNPDAVSFIKDGEPDSDPRPDGYSTVWNLGEMLYNSAVANGAEFVFETHAEQLVGDAASGISGVIATASDGSFVQFNATKGVVFATGDIGGNQEMIDAFAPICNRADANLYTPAGCNTGDAILMGSWAGAAISKSPASPMVHQFTGWSVSFNLSAFIMCWPAVNLKGERYGAEMPFEPFLNNARMNTPGNKAWSIFDADYAQYVMAQWPNHYEKWLDGIEDEIETRVANGELLRADTLEDLADQLGVSADTFVKTIERYNTMYTTGVDRDFDVPKNYLSQVKTAPFYAYPLVCSVLTIPFGLHVNDDSQVCTAEDEAIAGLFAVGNAQGDVFGQDYPVHYPGISHGRCVTFGQLVGEALAKDTVLTQIIEPVED